MAFLFEILNLMWPRWTTIDPTVAWERVARAAVKDNERYVIEDDEAVRATGLRRIMIFRSAWDVLKTCPDETLIEPPASVKTVSQEDTDSIIVQIDCVTAQVKCHAMTRNGSSSLFAIVYCELLDEGRSD
jgi:hypothetical protein